MDFRYPVVSVLIPSRGRAILLWEAVRSLGDVEILIAIDENDPSKKAYYDTDYGDARIIECPHYGYGYLESYYNDLARISSGKWLLPWNDDAEMRSKDWVEILDKATTDKPSIAIFGEEKSFPLINRTAYNVMGHFSMGPTYDTYLSGIADRIGGFLKLDPVEIHHKRDYIHDQTEKDKTKLMKLAGKREASKEVLELREKDAQDILTWIDINK